MSFTLPYPQHPVASSSEDPRWGAKTEFLDQSFSLDSAPLNSDWALLGYPDDEGIIINKGRVGASEGPDAIRSIFYRTALGLEPATLTDIGNLKTEGPLAERHERAKQVLEALHRQNKSIITLGGSHDYGYPDGAAFLHHFKDQKSVVINFDAHLDVRPTSKGLSSGTPFFRLKEQFSKMNLVQFGIQPQCNAQAHYKWCYERDIEIIDWPTLLQNPQSLTANLSSTLERLDLLHCPAFLSLDIDVFHHGIAPGCSQSWATGLDGNQFFLILNWLKSHLKIKHFGIYEVSPPLDHGVSTSRLAAQWIHQLLERKTT